MANENQNSYAKVWGSSASVDDYTALLMHVLSIPFTTWGNVEAFGLSMMALGLSKDAAFVLCLFVAIGIQLLIASRERPVAKAMVWGVFGGNGAKIMFAGSILFIGTLIWYNHQTSQKGRAAKVDQWMPDTKIQADPAIDSIKQAGLFEVHAKYQSDSLAIASTLASSKKANRSKRNSILVPLGNGKKRSPRGARLFANTQQTEHPGWAAGIRENAKEAEIKAKAIEDAANVEAVNLANNLHATLLEQRRKDEAPILEQWRAGASSHTQMEQGRVQRHQEGKGLLDDSLFWVVVVTSIGSILIRISKEMYVRFSGGKMEGEAYLPDPNAKKIKEQIRRFKSTRSEVIARRLELTVNEYEYQSVNKGAYKVAPTRWLLGSALAAGLGFAFVQTSVFSFSDQQSMMLVPAPWNYVLLVIMLYAAGSFIYHERKRNQTIDTSSTQTKQPVDTISDTKNEPNTKSTGTRESGVAPHLHEDETKDTGVDTEPETDILKGDTEDVDEVKPTTQIDGVFEESVELGSVSIDKDALRLLEKNARKSYNDYFKAKTVRGLSGAKSRFVKYRNRLAHHGLKCTPTGSLTSAQVKRKGEKLQRVTWRKLDIQ